MPSNVPRKVQTRRCGENDDGWNAAEQLLRNWNGKRVLSARCKKKRTERREGHKGVAARERERAHEDQKRGWEEGCNCKWAPRGSRTPGSLLFG